MLKGKAPFYALWPTILPDWEQSHSVHRWLNPRITVVNYSPRDKSVAVTSLRIPDNVISRAAERLNDSPSVICSSQNNTATIYIHTSILHKDREIVTNTPAWIPVIKQTERETPRQYLKKGKNPLFSCRIDRASRARMEPDNEAANIRRETQDSSKFRERILIICIVSLLSGYIPISKAS